MKTITASTVILEGERRLGTIVNFTKSIISEIFKKIVHRDFELD